MEKSFAIKSQKNNLDYECSCCRTFVGTPQMHLKECSGCKQKVNWKEKTTVR